VLFTSDNGAWLSKGADGGSAGPLCGGKGSPWEGEIGRNDPVARRPAGEVTEPKPLYPIEEKAKGKAEKAK